MDLLFDCIYHYETDLKIVVEQDRLYPEQYTNIICTKNGRHIWNYTLKQNIYTLSEIDSLIESKFRESGLTDKFTKKTYRLKGKSINNIHLEFKIEQINTYWFSVLCNYEDGSLMKQYYFPSYYCENFIWIYNNVKKIQEGIGKTICACTKKESIY